MPLDNAAIAELLAIESKNQPMPRSKAYRRASRRAFTWPVEASELLEAGESLTQLGSVGPYLERVITELIERDVRPPPVPPERADFLTLAEARGVIAGASSPRGDLQMHTTWSDGGSTLEEMALAAAERGYDYVAITDHSAAGLRIVKGLDDARLVRQGREIAALNERLEGLRVLRSVEMNLSPAGEGDVDPAVLSGLDIVLGSFHSQLRKTEDQTERYLAAIANPHVHVLAHPRGRIYNFRLGLPADWPRVFAAAQAANKALEIDAYPDRQDLNVELLEIARDAGVRISIGTDAHHHPQLEWIDLGLAAALRASIPRERILNYMPLDELLGWTAEVRERAAA
jgi:histidinol phosphatase-like PHP family hydrolase